MSHQINSIYTFDDEYETTLDWTTTNVASITPSNPNILPPGYTSAHITPITPLPSNAIITHWRPSTMLQRLYDRFQNTILEQYPRIACVYCGRLLYPEKASWIFYNPSITYPLQQRIPNIALSFNPNTNC